MRMKKSEQKGKVLTSRLGDLGTCKLAGAPEKKKKKINMKIKIGERCARRKDLPVSFQIQLSLP